MSSERVDIRKAVLLTQAGSHALYGDLYLPPGEENQARPAVVLVFGGGWREGERSQQKVYGLNLAKAGFVCLAADYRPSSVAQWPAPLDDIQAAIRWLRQHAAEYRIDPSRIAISGNSSGGHLALMAAASTARAAAAGAEVSAVCAFYPPTRLQGLDEQSRDTTVQQLMGAEATAGDLAQASPLTFASLPFPPVLLVCGDADRRVPVEHTWLMYQALKAAGNTVELHMLAGQGHAFDADRDLAQLSAQMLASFLQRHV